MRFWIYRAFLASGAVLGVMTAGVGVAQARPQAAAPTAKVVVQVQAIIIRDIDLEFELPAEYRQPEDKDSTAGDAFEAYLPAGKEGFRPHIELILFRNLPANAEMSKDIVEQIARSMGQKVNDFKIEEQAKTAVAGKDVQTISSTFRFKADKSNKTLDASLLMRNKQVLFIHSVGGKDLGYMFVFTTTASAFPDQVPAFDRLTASISYPSAAK
jgi:hypothetical protein